MTTSTPMPDHQWIERTLSTGVKLAVQSMVTLRIGDCESFMFTLPIQDVRQVTLGPRSDMALPWNVDIAYQGAHFSFTCTADDLPAVRYIFAEVPLVDMAARISKTLDQ